MPVSNNSRTVYSTEAGRLCSDCEKAIGLCVCQKVSKQFITGDDIVRVARETKGRKGKGVSLIAGIPLVGDELKALAKKLKQFCGTGGTVKNGIIEIQGDHRDRLISELHKLGYQVKKSGG